MKSAGWIALVLVVAVSVGGWAQCGCEEAGAPACYMTFRSNETIEFTLVAPLDYFVCHGTSVSPSIWGWRVETLDGIVVRTFAYSRGPVGRWVTMEWDLYDGNGYLVDPGWYRIVVMTTDGDVSYPVRILERCRPCWGCWCWCSPCVVCDVPCCVPYGELYLSLAVGETRPCYGLSFSWHFRFECSEP